MATRTFYVTRDTRHPLYKTRMLTAGQELPLSGSAAKLFRDLGVELSDQKPRKAAPPIGNATGPIEEPVARTIAEHEAPKPAAPKAAPKKAARRKKSK